MTLLRPWTIAVALGLVACTGAPPQNGGGDGATTETDGKDPVGTESAPLPTTLPKDDLADAENIALVPSVVEMQKALEAAGIDTKLAELIPDRAFDVSKKDIDDVAVRTGVVIADMLLTVKTSSDEHLLAELENIRTGMELLEGGDDVDKTIIELKDQIANKATNRDSLTKDLDDLSGAFIPELEFNGKKRVVPLIKAGSWLEGSNLVARAVKAKGKPDAADGLLKQPAVVDYFIRYVKGEGAGRAPAAVTAKLETALNTLKGIAEKKEPLNGADIDSVIKVTADVLEIL